MEGIFSARPNSATTKQSLARFLVDSSEDECESHPDSHPVVGIYDKPLPCFGCGMGWFSFILGFVFPPAWFCGALLYLTNYYEYDPRERSGLASAAIMALMLSTVIAIILLVVLFG